MSAASETTSWRRAALGGAGGMFVCMGLGRFSYTAMVPALIQSGQLSAIEAGLVGGLNLAGFLIGAFACHWLRRKVPFRALLLSAVWLAFFGLLGSAAPWGFTWLALCRGLLGVTTGLVMIECLALATATAPEGRRALSTGIVFAGVGSGILIAGVAVPWFLGFGVAWAWSGIALFGLVGSGLASWGWWRARDPAPAESAATAAPTVAPRIWWEMVAANFLFAFGIVPHTIYWVDYLVRDLGLGVGISGLHWSVVGVFAFLGPWLAASAAARIGTARALPLAFIVLGTGIGIPATGVLIWLSSAIFGAQPGLSTLMAARVRDMGTAAAMPGMIRVMILANGCGAATGGLLIPFLFEASGSYALMFLVGGGAMLLGGLFVRPRE